MQESMITRPVLTLKINFPCRKRERERGGGGGRREEEREREKELGNLLARLVRRTPFKSSHALLHSSRAIQVPTRFSRCAALLDFPKRNLPRMRGVVNTERTDRSPGIVIKIGHG